MVWMVIGGGIVLVVLAVLLSRARVPHDGVDNFRRQIDALSPEARRPVVGRVNEARQTTRDHGLTVRRVNPIAATNGADGNTTDHHETNDDDSVADNQPAVRRTDQESGRTSDADESSDHSSGGDTTGSIAGDDARDNTHDGAHDGYGDAAGESLDGS